MIWKRPSTSLKEETYLLEHKEVKGSPTNAVLSSGLLTDLVLARDKSTKSDDKAWLVG